MSTVIDVKNLGKRYSITHNTKGGYRTIGEALSKIFQSPLKVLRSVFSSLEKEEFWALRNINFSVQRGEILGIVGSNGAGKSTLLKILSRITDPNEGSVRIKGRVSSLLEVGTGFHPELTGRENIYLNGSILGMTRKEINEKFNDIVSFSGVEAFLDTPVKRYSSGMQVRLAFSVAAHLEPDILIVDEVLAVGDAAFQRKSIGKMEEVTKNDHRTILFVSHNMEAVAKLCKRSILLDKGNIKMDGDTDAVIAEYLSSYQNKNSEIVITESKDKPIQIKSIRCMDWGGLPQSHFDIGQPFKIEVTCETKENVKNGYVGIGFIDVKRNTVLLDTLDVDTNPELYVLRKSGVFTYTFEFANPCFNEGTIKLFVHSGVFPISRSVVDKVDGEVCLTFLNHDNIFTSKVFHGKRDGSFVIPIPCKVKQDN